MIAAPPRLPAPQPFPPSPGAGTATGGPAAQGCQGGLRARATRPPELRRPRACLKCCNSTPKRARGPRNPATPSVAAPASARVLAGAGGPGHALPVAGAAECGTLTRQSLLVINRAGAVELVNPGAAGQAAARALPRLGGCDTAPGKGTERQGRGGCARTAGRSRVARLGWGTHRHRAVWAGARGSALLPAVPVPAGGGRVTRGGGGGRERWTRGPGTRRHSRCEHPRGHARPRAAARSPPRAGRGGPRVTYGPGAVAAGPLSHRAVTR